MKAVIFYETGNTPMDAIKAAFPRHKVLLDAFHARGELLAVGTWANPIEGAMGIFKDRNSAEDFVRQGTFRGRRLGRKSDDQGLE